MLIKFVGAERVRPDSGPGWTTVDGKQDIQLDHISIIGALNGLCRNDVYTDGRQMSVLIDVGAFSLIPGTRRSVYMCRRRQRRLGEL